MNIIALAKLAYDMGGIEDPGQLASDGLALDQLYEQEQKGLNLSALTEAELNTVIPALSRTFIVLGDLWANPAKRQDIINAVKGL